MILVTGGTGLVGSCLIKYLIDKGEKVRGIKRPSAKGLPRGINEITEWVEGDIMDVFFLNEAMKNVEQVYHCAGVVSFNPKDKDTLMKVNVGGTANLVNAALENNIKKIVHVSSIAALGRIKGNTDMNENAQWGKSKLNSNYAVSKHLGEMEVWRGIAEGLNAVIVNPSVILGVGDWTNGALRFFSGIWNGMPYYSNHTTGFTDVRDVAKCMVQLMESDVQNQRFIISSENLSYREIFNEIADNFGKKRPHLKSNPFLSELAWRIEAIRKIITGGVPLITKETVRTANESFYYDNSKIKTTLNYQFIPIKETIKWACEKFMEELGRKAKYQ